MKLRSTVINLLVILLLFSACTQRQAGKTPEYSSGIITYKVSYPSAGDYGLKSKLFPSEITLVFNKDKAAFIATGGLGMVQIVNILDHSKRKYTSLLIDQFRDNYGTVLNETEIKANEESSRFSYKDLPGNKTIAGLNCRKAQVTDHTNNKTFEIYYSGDIIFNYSNSPYHAFDHLMTSYTHTVNDLEMQLEAVKIDLESPVDTSLFEIHGQYRWLSQQQFYTYLAGL